MKLNNLNSKKRSGVLMFNEKVSFMKRNTIMRSLTIMLVLGMASTVANAQFIGKGTNTNSFGEYTGTESVIINN